MSAPEAKLALRREGAWWVAYFAIAGRPPLELGRTRMVIAENEPAVKAKFIELNRLVMDAALAQIGVNIESWGTPEPAPESERSGNA